MTISNKHNLTRPPPEERPYGIRVTLPRGDSFAHLLGEDWHAEHWFPDRESRDRAMADMAARHPFSRLGDEPHIRLEAIER